MKKFAVILLTICLMSVMLCACTADNGGMDAHAETPEPNNDFYDWGMDHISMKDISPDVFLEVPLYRQASSYTCGVACTLSILRYAGYDFDVREDRLAATLGSTPEDGTNYHSIVDYLNSVYYEEEDNLMFEAEAKMEMTIDDLMACLDEGKLVICAFQAWGDPEIYAEDYESGHYAVVIGYDDTNLYFMDPSTAGVYTYIPKVEFETRWHDYDKDGKCEQLGIIVTPKQTAYDKSEIYKLD